MTHYEALMEVSDRNGWSYDEMIDFLVQFIEERTKATPGKLKKYLNELAENEVMLLSSDADDWHFED